MRLPRLCWSIRFQLTAFTALTFAVFAAVVLWATGNAFGEALQRNVAADISRTSRILNMALSAPSANGDLRTLAVFFGELVADEQSSDLTYMSLNDETGAALIAVGELPEPLPAPDYDVAEAALTGEVNVSQPILLADNAIGELHYGLATGHLIDANRHARNQALVAVVAAVVAVALLQLGFGIRWSHRLSGLVRASRAMVGGNFGYRADAKRPDEIGRLARYFNLMAVAIAERIAQLEAARQEVEALNSGLEKRVEQRTAELASKNNQLTEALDQLGRAQRQLIESEKLSSLGGLVAGVAHELNTPVGNALLAASTLQEELELLQGAADEGLKRSALDNFLQQAKAAVAIVHRNLDRTITLIASFKNVAVDQAGSQRRRFKLAEVVSEVMLTLHPMIRKTPYTTVIDIPPEIEMDSYPGAIGQIITNLVTNALTHAFDNRDHGAITIRVTPPEEGELCLTFSDDGVGMDETCQRRVFEPFFTTRLGQGGSGLGMHIVYTLTTGLLAGRIQIASAPGEGTQITLRLPLAPVQRDPS